MKKIRRFHIKRNLGKKLDCKWEDYFNHYQIYLIEINNIAAKVRLSPSSRYKEYLAGRAKDHLIYLNNIHKKVTGGTKIEKDF